MKLSVGKRKRLESVSDSRGVIGALAIDQRDALRSLFLAELKIEKQAVPREQLEEFNPLWCASFLRTPVPCFSSRNTVCLLPRSALRPRAC